MEKHVVCLAWRLSHQVIFYTCGNQILNRNGIGGQDWTFPDLPCFFLFDHQVCLCLIQPQHPSRAGTSILQCLKWLTS